MRALSSGGITRLVICGGDGTQSRVFSALAGSGNPQLPELVVPRFGTVGTIGRRWSLGRLPLSLVEHALTERGGMVVSQPSLRVRLREAERTEAVGCTLGAGLVSRFFEVYEGAERRGMRTALTIFARTFIGSFSGARTAREMLELRPARLEIDGAPQPASAYNLVVCSVFRDVGLGIRVTYRAPDVTGSLHLVASTLPAARLGRQGLRVFRGVPLRGPGIVDRLCQDFSLDFASRDVFVLDGELLSAKGFLVSAGPLLPIWTPAKG